MACGIFLDQGSNPCLLYWQVDSLPLSHQWRPAPLHPDFKCWLCIRDFYTHISIPHLYLELRLKDLTPYWTSLFFCPVGNVPLKSLNQIFCITLINFFFFLNGSPSQKNGSHQKFRFLSLSSPPFCPKLVRSKILLILPVNKIKNCTPIAISAASLWAQHTVNFCVRLTFLTSLAVCTLSSSVQSFLFTALRVVFAS